MIQDLARKPPQTFQRGKDPYEKLHRCIKKNIKAGNGIACRLICELAIIQKSIGKIEDLGTKLTEVKKSQAAMTALLEKLNQKAKNGGWTYTALEREINAAEAAAIANGLKANKIAQLREELGYMPAAHNGNPAINNSMENTTDAFLQARSGIVAPTGELVAKAADGSGNKKRPKAYKKGRTLNAKNLHAWLKKVENCMRKSELSERMSSTSTSKEKRPRQQMKTTTNPRVVNQPGPRMNPNFVQQFPPRFNPMKRKQNGKLSKMNKKGKTDPSLTSETQWNGVELYPNAR